jgi:acetyl-CoA C-acetyltransferase
VPEAVIAAAVRTPIGRAHKGSLADVRPEDLAAFAVRTALERVPGLDPADVVDVMVGCGMPEERQGMNLGRRVALLAGLPDSVPGTTVNRFCASSLQTIRMAYHAIKAGEGDAFVAAGVESITQVSGYPKSAEELHPRLAGGPDAITNIYIPMGMTAENVAERYGVDGPRAESTLERLASLEPAFLPGGKVTAGNACPLNDGAAAVVVLSEEKARSLGISPRARIVASSVSGVDPKIMGVGPIEAVRKVLAQTGMTIEDVDVVELNEAFAAQVLPVCRELGIDPFGEQLNPHGGAIALGHPYGMSGARIMCTLLNDLDSTDGTNGLETMCVGGGQGMAMIVERLS